MSSFNNIISGIKSALETYSALTDFCQNRLGRKLTVTTAFKQRTEIPLANLPIIILTHPSIEKSFLNNNVLHGRHILRLYAGMFQQNRHTALSDLIEYEEMIEDALWSVTPELIGAMSITPLHSANDEGYNHPAYFLAMDIEIQHRRMKT